MACAGGGGSLPGGGGLEPRGGGRPAARAIRGAGSTTSTRNSSTVAKLGPGARLICAAGGPCFGAHDFVQQHREPWQTPSTVGFVRQL